MHASDSFLDRHTPLRFLLSSGVATALHYGVMLFVIGLGAPAAAASSIGAAMGAVANYGMQYRFTFRSEREHAAAARRYLAAVSLSWLLNLAVFLVLHSGLHLNVYVAQVLTTSLVACANYLVFKHQVFR